MKKLKQYMGFALLTMLLLVSWSASVQAAERLKPFVLAEKTTGGDFDAKVAEVKDKLTQAGFQLVGEYTPYEGTHVDKAHVLIVTRDDLIKAATASERGAFAAPWRVAITQVGDEIQVAYPNPAYVANAYRLNSDLAFLSKALANAIGAAETFGSKKGMTAKKLRKYHYTFGMEYFDDPYELAEYDSHKEAVETLEKNLTAGKGGVHKVYRLDLPNEQTIFGVSLKMPEGGDEHMDDAWVMSNVDFESLKTTAYLPIEILVDGKEVVALHMRFRMAMHRPDLKMMGKNSFMNIMSSPKAIGKALETAAGGD